MGIEHLLLAIVTVNVCLTCWAAWDAIKDQQWHLKEGQDGVRGMIASNNVWQECLRLGKQLVILTIAMGFIYDKRVPAYFGWVLISLLMLLASFMSRRVRYHVEDYHGKERRRTDRRQAEAEGSPGPSTEDRRC